MSKNTLIVDVNSLLTYVGDVEVDDKCLYPYDLKRVFLNPDIMHLISLLSNRVAEFSLVFLAECYKSNETKYNLMSYIDELFTLSDQSVQSVFDQCNLGDLDYSNYRVFYSIANEKVDLENSIIFKDAVFISSSPFLLNYARNLGASTVSPCRYASLCEGDIDQVEVIREQYAGSIKISVYLDIDNTLLNRNQSILNKSTVLNLSVVNSIKELKREHKGNVSFKIITARIEEKEAAVPDDELSVVSVLKALSKLGIDIDEASVTYTGCLRKDEHGKYSHQLVKDKVEYIKDIEREVRSSVVLFFDDNKGEIEAARKSDIYSQLGFVPIMVNSGYELRQQDIDSAIAKICHVRKSSMRLFEKFKAVADKENTIPPPELIRVSTV